MRIMHISRATLMVCQFMIPLIKAQQQRGHYVCVCGSDDEHVDTLRAQGIDVFTHQLRRSLNPWALIRAIGRVKRHILEQDIDVVVCHSPLGAGVGRIAARLAGCPHRIYFAHGLPCAPGQAKLKWLVWYTIEKILARLTTGMVVMNRYDQALAVKRFFNDDRRVFRIPGMGIDLSKFNELDGPSERQALEQELDIPPGSKIVLCIAYLIPEKGIYQFFRAAQVLCGQRQDVYFLIAGDGPHQTPLETTSYVSQLADRFQVLGWRDDIDRLMRGADIFVLPTYYFEGLPVSILEAMACAKPVIATRHRGCEDAVVDCETGFLIPTRQVVPLIHKLEMLLDQDDLRWAMGQAGRQRVESTFELGHCTDLIADVLDRACGGSQGSVVRNQESVVSSHS
jgi:glycosyltransferase involved in cell wall biosynthesis